MGSAGGRPWRHPWVGARGMVIFSAGEGGELQQETGLARLVLAWALEPGTSWRLASYRRIGPRAWLGVMLFGSGRAQPRVEVAGLPWDLSSVQTNEHKPAATCVIGDEL